MPLRSPTDHPAQRSDAELAAALARGDTQALALLYHRHARELLAVAFRLLQSQADAEDVVHDVFVGLPEALRRYQERGALGAWLRKVTARTALMRLREEATRRTEPLDPASAAAPANPPDATLTIERALQRLSPGLRAVLVLKEIEGFSHAEIAAMLDISVGASEVRLHRALRALRAMLLKDDAL
jgi:RNA polymerase sigma-70 factor (ECF subfamily)